METQEDIRPSPIAGQWYPADPRRLASTVDEYLQAAQEPPVAGEIVALVSPHAGLLFSGPVAGYAFSTLVGLEPEIVAIVSPMHHPYNQALLTSAHSAYQTPLGCIPIDRESVDRLDICLQETLGIGLSPVYHDPEHALEIELPFLQRVLKREFGLLPVMIRDQSKSVSRVLGQALANTLANHRAIMIASTDLSHFYPQEVAAKLDAEMLRKVESFDPEGVYQVEELGEGFACGRGALTAVMWAARSLGADTVKVLRHATSGDVTGDYLRVVGYAAAVITRKTPITTES